MSDISNRLIDLLGGTTAVAELLLAKVSTVQSWRRIGIARHHANHIRLAVEARGLVEPEVVGLLAALIGDDDSRPFTIGAGVDIGCADALAPDNVTPTIGVAA